MTQKFASERSAEITKAQLVDAEHLIQNYWPKGPLESGFRADLKDALILARDCYKSVLMAVPAPKPVRRRELQTLSRAIAVVRIHLNKEEVQHQIAAIASKPPAPAKDREKTYEASGKWQSELTEIGNKIDRLKTDLEEIQAAIDIGLNKKNSKSAEAIPRPETEAVALAAGAFLSQLERWGMPSGLWHQNMTPSPAASIIVGILEILGIKCSERAVAALKSKVDPEFCMPFPGVPTRARGKRR